MNVAILEDMERLERLEMLISELQTLADSGAIIVVEGRRDEESLRFLGIKGEIMFASRQPLLEFAELLSMSGKEIVLLTDWDKKGGIIARKIIQHLVGYGIMPNRDIRGKIGVLVKKRIKDVESLNNYINKLRYELHGVTRF
jgi:5S rRNA maturation endonuclease (ribonuclease M5)